MLGGFLKFFRSILDWEHYKDINTFKLFLHFLLTANIKDTKYMGYIVPRGSLVIREKNIGEECGLSYQEVRTSIKRLLVSGEITKKSTNKFIIVTIVNYSTFQDLHNDQQRTTNEQLTNNQRPINDLLTSIEEEDKEGEEDKEEKNNPPLPPTGGRGKKGMSNNEPDTRTELLNVWNKHLLDVDLKNAAKKWLKYKTEKRQSYKPQGLNSLLIQIGKKAEQYGNEAVINLITESMSNNWEGIAWGRLEKTSLGGRQAVPKEQEREGDGHGEHEAVDKRKYGIRL